MGLRLNSHDGGSEGVIEMGLMGRRSVHNGDTPASLKWDTVDDIVSLIRRERSLLVAGVDRAQELHDEVMDHIELTSNWLNLETWGP